MLRKTLFIFKQESLMKQSFFFLFNLLKQSIFFRLFLIVIQKFSDNSGKTFDSPLFFVYTKNNSSMEELFYVKNDRVPTTEYLLL